MSISEFDKNATEVLVKCGRHCCICRRFRLTMLQVHHIVECQDGGSDDIDNLIAACLTCHSDVHTERPFARRFTVEELKQHRDCVYELVEKGILVPPNDDAIPVSPKPVNLPVSSGSQETFIITPKEGLIQPRLPKESVEILRAAANSPGGHVLAGRTVKGGYAVKVGDRNFVTSRNTREEACYENAVKRLVENGFLTGHSPGLRVTHQGFLLVDALEASTSHKK